jgi:hypothetical protein
MALETYHNAYTARLQESYKQAESQHDFANKIDIG